MHGARKAMITDAPEFKHVSRVASKGRFDDENVNAPFHPIEERPFQKRARTMSIRLRSITCSTISPEFTKPCALHQQQALPIMFEAWKKPSIC
jgi:hypothetical protein